MNGHALWYLTRGSGVVALLLLTLVVLLGVTSTFRWRSALLPKFLVAGLHRNLTLLAIDRPDGGTVPAAACIIELAFLEGRRRLDVPLAAMITYNS